MFRWPIIQHSTNLEAEIAYPSLRIRVQSVDKLFDADATRLFSSWSTRFPPLSGPETYLLELLIPKLQE